MKILQIIKEATKDHLSEETFRSIESGVQAEVDKMISEKVEAAVQVALDKQDADHSASLQKFVEKLDTDRARKLVLALETMETEHIAKLLELKESYDTVIRKQSADLRDELRVQISKYLDIQLEKAIPTKQLKEAARESFARNILVEARKLFSINDIYKNEVVVSAVKDGVSKIKDLEKQLTESKKQLNILAENKRTAEAKSIIMEKTANLPEQKVAYLRNFFKDKTPQYIKENFDYVVKLYDKEENERRHTVSEETKELRRRSNVDRLLTEKRNDEAEFSSFTPEEQPSAVLSYIGELKKNDSRRFGNV